MRIGRPNSRWSAVEAGRRPGKTSRKERTPEQTLTCLPITPLVTVQLEPILELIQSDRLEDALALVEESIKKGPETADLLRLNARLLLELGQMGRARTSFERLCQELPDDHDANWNLTLLLLLEGQFQQGWARHEDRPTARQMGDLLDLGGDPIPRWGGEPLDGQRMILVGEQGLGDQIQFLRFAPEMATRADVVDVGVAPEIHRIAESVSGISTVVSSLPARRGKYNYWIQLMSLPHFLGLYENNDYSKIHYISPPSVSKDLWKGRLDRQLPLRPRVGIVWAGNESNLEGRNRIDPQDIIDELLTVDDVSFVGLQKGPRAGEIHRIDTHSRLVDISNELEDFCETAAVVVNLDLVISVDTAVAHLAGALGRPVWNLIPFIPDWRWGVTGEQTPWYPTMKLIRQRHRSLWRPTLEAVRRDLETLVASWRSPLLQPPK